MSSTRASQPAVAPFAERMARLGTETAFAVSDDAKAWAAQGHDVYPFHLGDIDLPTPPNIVEAAHRALLAGRTGYCSAGGLPELRQAIAEDVGRARGIDYGPRHVSVQPGGKPSIAKFVLMTVEPGVAALYPSPGYPIYESMIRCAGGEAVPYGFTWHDDGFRIDREEVEASITERTKVVFFNNGHNPLGAESDAEELEWLAELCRRHDLWLFSDEPYFDIRYAGESRSIASLPGMAERTVIGFTFSKRYAMTGWRLGAAVGPQELVAAFDKWNTNLESCTPPFVQLAGVEALRGDQSGRFAILGELQRRRDALVDALREIDGVVVHRPDVTFYLFPDVTEVYRRKGYGSEKEMRVDALQRTGVSFCSRSHFGQPRPGEDRVFVRFAYSGISVPRIEEGLAKLEELWES